MGKELDRPEGLYCRILIGRYGKGERINNDILFVDPIFGRAGNYALCYRDAPLGGIGNSLLIEGKGYNGSALFFHKRKYRVHYLGLSVYRIYKRLAVIDTHRCPKRLGA